MLCYQAVQLLKDFSSVSAKTYGDLPDELNYNDNGDQSDRDNDCWCNNFRRVVCTNVSVIIALTTGTASAELVIHLNILLQ